MPIPSASKQADRVVAPGQAGEQGLRGHDDPQGDSGKCKGVGGDAGDSTGTASAAGI